MDDELVPIVRTGGRLAKYDTITLEQLRAVPLVLREFGSGSLDVLQKALETQHIALTDLNIEMNLGTTELLPSITSTTMLGLRTTARRPSAVILM